MRLSAVAAAVRDKSLSPVDLVDGALDAARKAQDLNPLAELHGKAARDLAVQRSDEAAAGLIRGPLHGVPVTVKDLFVVAGFRMRAGTRAPLPSLDEREATAVRRLREAGAIVVATTNLVEIALGIHGENPWTGDVRNPHDRRRQAGGSSSGSAVAVATGIGLASLGTDTGGSLRIPASLCGVTTIKPSYGTVPADGMLSLSPTCDHVGPLASSVADVAYLLDVLTGSTPRPVDSSCPRRIGVPRHFLAGRLGTAVRAAFEAVLDELSATPGVDIVEVDPTDLELADQAYLRVVRREAARVHRAAIDTAPDSFSPAVRKALLLGRSLSPRDYLQGRQMADRVRAGLDATLADVDILLLPATPLPAPVLGSREVAIESGRVAHRDAFLPLTLPFNLAGVPVVCLPFTEVDGLPVGVQLVAARGQDLRALAYGQWLESFLASRRSASFA
jgi:aspartyl-tRNA(Asn)/glutamyl-tRNA(Gln) amidotransferase subunit A